VTWVGRRLQRTETLIAIAILALIALLLVPTGLHMASAYQKDGLSSCVAASASGPCNDAVASFLNRFQRLGDLLAWFTLIPGLIGVLLAAPFVLEIENGTYRLAWTQSITRRRWIVTRLAAAAGAAVVVVVVGLLIVLTTWWRGPLVQLNGRMETSTYDTEGIVAIGYTLFALGLALAVGVLWRRTVPAVLVAFAGYFASRIFVDTWLGQRLVSASAT
jgi:ABC-type transport system involved in multi-copper enzyme maturation permease subunit